MATVNRIVANLSLKDYSVFLITLMVFVTAGTPGFNLFYYSLGAVVMLRFLELALFRKAIIQRNLASFCLPIVAFMVYSFFSLTWAIDFSRGLARFFHIIVSGIFFLVMVHSLSRSSSLKALRLGVIFGSMFAFGTSIVEYSRNPFQYRLAGAAGNANVLALLLMIAFLILINPLMKPTLLTWIYGVVILTYATVFTGSRKTLIIWPLILIYIGLRNAEKRSLRSRVNTIIMVLAIFIALLLFGEPVLNHVTEITSVNRLIDAFGGEEASAKIRSIMIREGIELWKTRPLIGFGPDQFSYHSMFGTYSHNNYVELLSTSGIIGTILYYSLYLLLFMRAIKISDREQKYYTIISLVFLLFLDFFLISYYVKYLWLFLSTLVTSLSFSSIEYNVSVSLHQDDASHFKSLDSGKRRT